MAIVGAGYCGLSAARELAKAGKSVVVLDRDPLGVGASTRNGGMAIPELKAGPAALTRRYGARGGRMYAEVNEAFDYLENLLIEEHIECDYERTGQLYLAHNQASVPYLQAMAHEHGEDLGEPVRFVPREELGQEIGSNAFQAGLVIERTGSLHPAKYHAALARLALVAGADVCDVTTVMEIQRGGVLEGRPYRLVTDRGNIAAGDVLIATNAYADGLVPALRRRVIPVSSSIIATEVLDPDLARSVSPRNRMFVDTRNFLHYWRLSPDGRMLFGGRKSMAPTTVEEARAFLQSDLVKIHPQLKGVPVTHAWTGRVAITVDRMPHFGRLRRGAGTGALFATGCNGSGVALNSWMGVRAAEVLLGGQPPAFSEISFPPVPFHGVRAAWLPIVGGWFLHKDHRP